MEEGAHHRYPGRAKVPVEELANLAAAAVAPAAVVVDVVAALGLVVATEPAGAAAAAVVVVAAAVVEPVAGSEAQESGDFVAGHHCHQTSRWEREAG